MRCSHDQEWADLHQRNTSVEGCFCRYRMNEHKNYDIAGHIASVIDKNDD
jgi:hypothetical protein